MSVQFITVTFHQLSSCLVLQVSFVGIEIPVPRERVCVAFPVKYWVKPIDNFDALYKANLFGRFSYLTEIRVILLKDFKILSVKFCRRDFTASCRYDHLVGNIVSWNYVASVFIEDENNCFSRSSCFLFINGFCLIPWSFMCLCSSSIPHWTFILLKEK